MTRRFVFFLLSAGAIADPQVRCYNCDAVAPPPRINYPERPESAKLPDGRSQQDAILKADHEASLKQADELIRMAEALKADLEKNDRYFLSVSTLRKLDDIQKLVKHIRDRMKRL